MIDFDYLKPGESFEGRRYIGASDMPTLTGISKYKTPLKLWEQLTGRDTGSSSSRFTEWGHKAEDMILAEYINRTCGDIEARDFIASRMLGDNVYEYYHSNTAARYRDNNRLVAHADLIDLTGENPVIIEAKNTGEFAAMQRKRDVNAGYDRDDMSENGIPLGVYYQVQFQMALYEIDMAYVTVLIGGNDWRMYGPVRYSKSVAENLISLSYRMLELVDTDTPPTPQTWQDVTALFPHTEKGKQVILDGEDEINIRSMLEEYGKLSEKEKKIAERKEDIKNAIGLYAQDAQYIVDSRGNKLASTSEIAARESISISDLKKHPEIYQAAQDACLIKTGEGYRSIYFSGISAGDITRWTLITYPDGQDGKPKKSRKKYSSKQKKDADQLLKTTGILYRWEKYGG